MLHLRRNTVYLVSLSLNAKPALGSLLTSLLLLTTNKVDRWPQPMRYFLFFSSLFFILYPIRLLPTAPTLQHYDWRLSCFIKFVYHLHCLLESLLTLVSEVKVAKSGPTLGDPMDCSPSGSSVHGLLQPRILEWVAVGRFFTVWSIREAQEYWSEKTFPSPGDLPNPGIEPAFPILEADSSPAEVPGKPHLTLGTQQILVGLKFTKLLINFTFPLWCLLRMSTFILSFWTNHPNFSSPNSSRIPYLALLEFTEF